MRSDSDEEGAGLARVVPLDARTYDSLFEHMLNGLAYCRMLFVNGQPEDFIYLYTNPAFHTQTHLGEVVGKKVSEVIPGIREADPQLFEIYGRVAVTGKPEKFETHVRSLNEWFSINVYSPKEGYFVAVFDVITEKKRVEAALLESEERYRRIVETANEGIWSVDANHRTTFVNPAMCRMLGYSPEEMVGRLAEDFLFEADLSEHVMKMQERHAGNGDLYERRFRSKDGGECWCAINSTPIMDEQGAFAGSFAMITDITERKKIDELVWRQANFDSLTRLPNRQMFMDRLEQGIRKSHRTGAPLALLFLDLDQFKEINDTLGHDKGDILLKEAANRLTTCLRESDTVARPGGDEFTVVLDDASSVEQAAQKILKTLAEPFLLGDQAIYLTTSIGITFYPQDAGDLETLIKNADQAMYAAKSQGRNRYSYFTPSMQAEAQKRMRLANELRGALAASQFQLHYQPIVDLATGLVHKAEALIRWQHPSLGLVSPAEFIPVAEDTGIIVDIGNWVFGEAVRQVSLWRETLHEAFQISVNKSPVQFRSESVCLALLEQLGLPGNAIVVEITENSLMDGSVLVMDQLIEYRDAGIQVAIDDFGTGYSSLSYIRKFDIDYLKIDQSFIRNLTPESEDLALCEAIVVMAHRLGIKVIAEGVETLAQRDLVVRVGCDYAQGYLYSRPIPPESFHRLISGF